MLRSCLRGLIVMLAIIGIAGVTTVPASANEPVVTYGCLISQNHGTLQPSDLAPGQIGVAPLTITPNGKVIYASAYDGAWGATCQRGNSAP